MIYLLSHRLDNSVFFVDFEYQAHSFVLDWIAAFPHLSVLGWSNDLQVTPGREFLLESWSTSFMIEDLLLVDYNWDENDEPTIKSCTVRNSVKSASQETLKSLIEYFEKRDSDLEEGSESRFFLETLKEALNREPS